MAKITKDDVLGYLESANMLEVSELIKDIEDKFNVSAAAPVAVAGARNPGYTGHGVACLRGSAICVSMPACLWPGDD